MQNNQVYLVQRTPASATVSLVFGILSFIGFGLIGAFLVAIIAGHMALSQIKRSGNQLGGKGQAVAGLILGYISGAIALGILLFFLFVGGIGMFTMQKKINQAQSEWDQAKQVEIGRHSKILGTYEFPDDKTKMVVTKADENANLNLLLENGETCNLKAGPDSGKDEVKYQITGCLESLGRKPDVAYFLDEDGSTVLVFGFQGEAPGVRRHCKKIK